MIDVRPSNVRHIVCGAASKFYVGLRKPSPEMDRYYYLSGRLNGLLNLTNLVALVRPVED